MLKYGRRLPLSSQDDSLLKAAWLNRAKSDLLRAEANLASSESRYRESLKVSVASEQDYDAAKAAVVYDQTGTFMAFRLMVI